MSKIKSARMELSTVRADRPRFQVKLLTALVGAALAQVASPALADSGTEGDPWLGNALNPAGVTTARPIDPDGLGGQLSRTPTGFLENNPFVIQPFTKSASGWQYRGIAEFGYLADGGDKDAQKWREYKDLSNGLYLNNFLFEAEKPESLTYVRALGGAWGRDDQYYGLTVGQFNGYRLRVFYNQTPHVFTTTYRNLWSGEGTGNVTLRSLRPGGLPAGAAATDTAIEQAALATPYSELAIQRQKGGLRFDMPITDAWKVYASATSEKRTGARPFGLVEGGGGGTGGIEIPESIDYDTHDFAAGANWTSGRTAVNIQASASMFRNNVSTMTIDNPMFIAATNGVNSFPQARFDLYPDNDAYNLKGEASHAFGGAWNPRLTGVYSLTHYRQDDALIASTPYAGVTVNNVAGGAWDTTASLSRQTAQQKLDTQLVDLTFALTPTPALDVKAKWRQYETDNKSPEYFACNPLNGQWGRVVNEGSGAAMVAGATAAGSNAILAARCNLAGIQAQNILLSAGNVNIASIPYEYKQTNAGVTADYRLAAGQSVNAMFERESFDRENRERAETREDKLKVGYVNRSLGSGTLRLSAEHDRRRGSQYVSDPYDEFYSASMGAMPTANGTNVTSWIHINDLHRKYDLADRDQNILNAKFNWALREDLDLAITGQLKSSKYPSSAYGRNDTQKQNSINADLNWQPTTKTNLYGFGGYQKASMAQKGIQQNACALGSNYFFYSDGSVNTTGTLTAQQQAAGITVVGNSGVVTANNFASLCGTASPTSPLYPTSRAWSATQDESSPSLGFGVRHDFGKALMDVNYTFIQSKTEIAYTYNPAALGLVTSGAATAAQLTALGLIGSGMPDLVFKQHIINASVLFPVNQSVAVRLLARYEIGKFKDWHYEGVAANPSPAANQQTYLDAGPQDYRSYAFGAFLQLKW